MKRGNIKSTKVYVNEDGKMVTKYAVQVRLRGRQNWIQAKKGEMKLIFNTQEEADQVVIDYVDHLKQSAAITKARREKAIEKRKESQGHD